MAEEFQTGICSTGHWRSSTTSAFDGPTMSSPVSCTTELNNIAGSFNWLASTNMVETRTRSCDESPTSVSNSSVTFHDTYSSQAPDQMVAVSMMDSTPQLVGFGFPSSTVDWSHPFLTSERAETNFHALLQEDMTSSRSHPQQHEHIKSNQIHMGVEGSSSNLFKDLNRGLDQQDHLPNSGIINSLPLLQPSALQGLLEPDLEAQQQSFHNNQLMTYKSPMNYFDGSNEFLQSSWAKVPQFVKTLPQKQQLQFSNNAPFWNASAPITTQEISSLCPPTTTQFAMHALKEIPNCSNLMVKSNSGGVGNSSPTVTKKSCGEPAFKKPRIETPSTLPTFKVRKEKLGDRITALQQLVSPFGKTDTASVLHEAIQYIKFLHGEVGVLSAPYLKNGNQMQNLKSLDQSNDVEGPNLDLQSRGLCLVPISSTYAVASEIPVDFWTPTTFGGSYR